MVKLHVTIFINLLHSIVITMSSENECVSFGGRQLIPEIVQEGVNNLRDMVFNRNENAVYFIFEFIGGQNQTAIGYVDINTKRTGVIEGIRNARSIAIDQKSNTIYVGGSDGLFKISDNDTPIKLHIDESIRSLFFKNNLCFVNNRLNAFRITDGVVRALPEAYGKFIDDIIIDEDYNMFYLDKELLCRLKLGTLAVNTHEKLKVNVITTDNIDRAYFGADDGVYKYNKYNYSLTKVSDMRDLKGLTFSRSGEPVYAIADKIVKLSFQQGFCKV